MGRLSLPFARRSGGLARLEALEGRRLLHGTPHADPEMQREHEAVFALVPDSAVTHAAAASGDWSDPATWSGGALPAAEANVLIPSGVTVTVDGSVTDVLRTIRVDGALQFVADASTSLTVDTVVVSPSGSFTIGTAAEPVLPGVTARVVFADRGPIDTTWDPNLLSRGLISHGTTTVYGAAKTPFAALAGSAARGSSLFTLAHAPAGWQVGDEVVLAGTSTSANQDERVTVTAIDGPVVTVNRVLSYNHASPRPAEMPVYVANVTRNVVFESQSRDRAQSNRRGHVMLMHSPHADVNYAGFSFLGRTDKDVRINDPQLDAAGALVPGTGTNPRARYALHLHRTGLDPVAHGPATVRGSVANDGVGWGFVNHSSYVTFEDNVAYNIFGAGFVSEAGDEIGSFRRNFALRSTGSGDGIESRNDIQDFGHEGNGFWFQGGGVEVEDNVAAGQRRGAFVYFTRGLQQAGLGTTRFPSPNLADPSIANGAATMDVGNVPIRLFRNNYAFSSGDGFESWFHLLNASHSARSLVEGFRTWGFRSGRAAFIPYTRHMDVRHLTAVGNMANPSGTGIARNDVTRSARFEYNELTGFDVGISAPKRGTNFIRGGYLNNVKNVDVAGPMEANRTVDVTGVRFGRLSAAALRGRRQYDVHVRTRLEPYEQDLTDVFGNDTIRLNSRQIYSEEQAPGFVPFPEYTDPAAEVPAYGPNVPAEFIGKTNAQLWEQYGLAVGGAVAPAGAYSNYRVTGVLGTRAEYPKVLTLNSAKYTRTLTGYALSYTPAGGRRVTETQRVDLREGWNVLTRTIEGRTRTFLVLGDVTAPTFQSTKALTIDPAALANGYRVEGRVTDNSTGETSYSKSFHDLLTRPVVERADGTPYIALDFRVTDRAGNATDVVLELNLVSATLP